MSEQVPPASGKKPWPGLKAVDVGSIDEQTTAGVGNLGGSRPFVHELATI